MRLNVKFDKVEFSPLNAGETEVTTAILWGKTKLLNCEDQQRCPHFPNMLSPCKSSLEH